MRKVGIWIDQREANIVTIANNNVSSKTVYSDIDTRIRVEGEKKQFGRFGDQYLVDEKGKKNRIKEYTQKFLNRVMKELATADEILLFGPAQTKFNLEKLISQNMQMASKLRDVKVSENMTHNQKMAYVRDYFKA